MQDTRDTTAVSRKATPRTSRREPFPAWPHFDDDEIAASVEVLRSGKVNYWTGEEGRRFEQEFAASCNCKHAVALTNGTAALELALEALGIGEGHDVLVTSRTFVASASAIVRRGARPIMVDVDRDSQNVTAETLRDAATPDTRAIIAVHLAGWPCDMDDIVAFARERDLRVIEDCAQAHGARYKGRPVGSLGDIGAFSFCQDKIMTTGGEGGMVTTNDETLSKRMWSLKDHGKGYDVVYNKAHPPGFRWLHEEFGTNWRLTEAQSAIGRVQLRKLETWVEARRRNAAILTEALGGLDAVRIPTPPAEIHHSYYKFYAFVRPERLREGWDRDRILTAIMDEGVPIYSGSCSEIYLEECFERYSLRPRYRLPVAKELGETSLMFLVHPTLRERHVRDVGEVARNVLALATQR